MLFDVTFQEAHFFHLIEKTQSCCGMAKPLRRTETDGILYVISVVCERCCYISIKYLKICSDLRVYTFHVDELFFSGNLEQFRWIAFYLTGIFARVSHARVISHVSAYENSRVL